MTSPKARILCFWSDSFHGISIYSFIIITALIHLRRRRADNVYYRELYDNRSNELEQSAGSVSRLICEWVCVCVCILLSVVYRSQVTKRIARQLRISDACTKYRRLATPSYIYCICETADACLLISSSSVKNIIFRNITWIIVNNIWKNSRFIRVKRQRPKKKDTATIDSIARALRILSVSAVVRWSWIRWSKCQVSLSMRAFFQKCSTITVTIIERTNEWSDRVLFYIHGVLCNRGVRAQ